MGVCEGSGSGSVSPTCLPRRSIASLAWEAANSGESERNTSRLSGWKNARAEFEPHAEVDRFQR